MPSLRERGRGQPMLPHPTVGPVRRTIRRAPTNRRLGRRNTRPRDFGLATPADLFPKPTGAHGVDPCLRVCGGGFAGAAPSFPAIPFGTLFRKTKRFEAAGQSGAGVRFKGGCCVKPAADDGPSSGPAGADPATSARSARCSSWSEPRAARRPEPSPNRESGGRGRP